MKISKLIVLCICFCFSILSVTKLFAQKNSPIDSTFRTNNVEETEILPLQKDKKLTTRAYIMGGMTYIPSFNLSNSLTKEGLSSLNKMPIRTIGAGFTIEYKRFTFGGEVARLSFEDKKNDFNYRLKGQQINYSIAYRVLGTKELGLNLGIIAIHTNANLEIYSNNSTLNLNNLSSSTIQSNSLSLNYKPVSLGFTIGLIQKENTKLPFELLFSYQRTFNAAKWSSDFTQVTNSPFERGQNIFSLTARFYLFKKSSK